MAQINRTMEQVVQQVALSRGINLVLNRAQVLGTTADFDLTPEVVEVLNKVLPTVVIPPDGVSPVTMAPPKSEPGAPAEAKPGRGDQAGARQAERTGEALSCDTSPCCGGAQPETSAALRERRLHRA